MGTDPELDQLRRSVDALNQRLVDVLHQRAALCRRIGRRKRALGLAAFDPERERAMLSELCAEVPADGFAAPVLHDLLAAVLSASRTLVEQDGGGA